MRKYLVFILTLLVFQFGWSQNWLLVDSIQLNSQNKITDFGTDDFNNLYWIENSSRLNKTDFNTRKNTSFSNHTVLESLNTQNILQITLKSGFFNLLVLDNQLNQTSDLIEFPMESDFSPTLISLVDNNYLWGYDPGMQRLVLWNYRQNKIWRQSGILSEKTADEFYSDLIYAYNQLYLIGPDKILIFDEYAQLEAVLPFADYRQIQLQNQQLYYSKEDRLHVLDLETKLVSDLNLVRDFDYFSINPNYLFVLKDKLVYLYAKEKN